jgi:2-desacetyl-2-hydroxyethyl bacteriochlorophyllide A dehydrogenase
VVRAENAVAFHTDVPLEWGALVEPFAVGWHAVELASIEPDDRVLVVGGGPIGLGAALAARHRGARRVIVSEPNAHRRQVASTLDLESADPRTQPPAPSSFDVAFECVGLAATLATALSSVRPRGEVVLVGLAEETIALPATPLVVGERRLVGSSAYTTADFEATARWIASGATDLSGVIELRVDLDGMADVFERYANGSLDAMKALFQP